MPRLPFIAELHDVGKLIDVKCLRLSGQMSKRQKVHDIDLARLGVSPPSASSWWATLSEELTGMIERFFRLKAPNGKHKTGLYYPILLFSRNY